MSLFIIIFILLVSKVKSEYVTFKNVEFRGYRLYKEVFSRRVISVDVLQPYIPHLEFDLLKITKQNIPVLYNGSLSNLATIDEIILEQNDISEIRPHVLVNVTMLRVLSFKDNQIKSISSRIFNGLNIAYLDLSRNRIKLIESQAFDNMTSLIHIQLSFNLLHTLNSDWFQNTPILTDIYLNNNLIEEIHQETFKNLKVLKFFGTLPLNLTLTLNHNKIKQKAFQNTTINILDLNHNKIKCLDPISNANILHLEKNPLECKCFRQLLTWYQRNSKEILLDDFNEVCEKPIATQ